MTRFDLIAHTGTLKEYRRESDWAYHRRIRRQMRYVWPVWEDILGAVEVIGWLILAAAGAGCVIAFPIMFFRWWMGM